MRKITLTAILCPALLATSAHFAGCNSMKSGVQTTDHVRAPQGGDMATMLPAGWTETDMQACMEAGMTGPQHGQLAKFAGRWSGTSRMWMAPGMPPMTNECNATITSMMDGRYTRCEYSGEMDGMGTFHGLGFNGFDNVSQKYVSTWMDNMGTGIMNGTGLASENGRTMTWNFEFSCPMTKKMTSMREVERHPDANTMSLEMFGPDPKTGKEFQMTDELNALLSTLLALLPTIGLTALMLASAHRRGHARSPDAFARAIARTVPVWAWLPALSRAMVLADPFEAFGWLTFDF